MDQTLLGSAPWEELGFDWSKLPSVGSLFYVQLLAAPLPKSFPLTGDCFFYLRKDSRLFNHDSGMCILTPFDWGY